MKHIVVGDLKFEVQPDSARVLVLDEKDFGQNTKLQIIRVNPGEQPKSHYHKVRIELAQIISGEGDIVVNDEAVVSKPGEFVLVQPGEVHTVVNRGNEPLVTMLLTVNDPGPEDMIYVEEEAHE